MAKGVLEFNLPEESSEHLMAVKALDFYVTLWDIKDHLRSKLKYGDLKENQYEVYEEIQDLLSSLMSERNISFDM